MQQAKFITFEGGEGTGKSTQTLALAKWLSGLGIAATLTREPGGSPFAEQVRALLLSHDTAGHGPLAESLLFYAARSDHLEKTIRPALAAGRWVICDRFSDSTRVYQGAAGGVDAHTIATLEEMVVARTQPDLTLILDMPAEAGMARAATRRKDTANAPLDNFESRNMDFHEKLRAGFLQLAARDKNRYAVIDARGSIDEISTAIQGVVTARLLDDGSLSGGG